MSSSTKKFEEGLVSKSTFKFNPALQALTGDIHQTCLQTSGYNADKNDYTEIIENQVSFKEDSMDNMYINMTNQLSPIRKRLSHKEMNTGFQAVEIINILNYEEATIPQEHMELELEEAQDQTPKYSFTITEDYREINNLVNHRDQAELLKANSVECFSISNSPKHLTSKLEILSLFQYSIYPNLTLKVQLSKCLIENVFISGVKREEKSCIQSILQFSIYHSKSRSHFAYSRDETFTIQSTKVENPKHKNNPKCQITISQTKPPKAQLLKKQVEADLTNQMQKESEGSTKIQINRSNKYIHYTSSATQKKEKSSPHYRSYKQSLNYNFKCNQPSKKVSPERITQPFDFNPAAKENTYHHQGNAKTGVKSKINSRQFIDQVTNALKARDCSEESISLTKVYDTQNQKIVGLLNLIQSQTKEIISLNRQNIYSQISSEAVDFTDILNTLIRKYNSIVESFGFDYPKLKYLDFSSNNSDGLTSLLNAVKIIMTDVINQRSSVNSSHATTNTNSNSSLNNIRGLTNQPQSNQLFFNYS